jgi:membrane dipeptidase
MTIHLDTTFGAFDFGLSAEDEARADHLHTEALIIDLMFLGPCGYRCFDPHMIAELQDEWERNRDGWTAYTSAFLQPIRRALQGVSSELELHWQATGIDCGNREITLDFIEVSFTETLRWAAATIAQFDRLPWLVKALTADDIVTAKAGGKRAGFMNAQYTAGMYRLEHLNLAHDLGVRMIMLTYNNANLVGTGCTDRVDDGLSNYGTRFVRRMNELGIIVDTSHCGRQTTLDACAVSSRPVVASHTSAAELYPIDRAKSDDEFRAIADTGGVIGVYAVPFFLAPGEDATINSMLDHIDYLADLVGWRHVAIGTDWPMQLPKWTLDQTSAESLHAMGFREEHNLNMGVNLNGFDDYRDFPNITRGLVKRGYSDEEIRGILGENFLRVFRQVCG